MKIDVRFGKPVYKTRRIVVNFTYFFKWITLVISAQPIEIKEKYLFSLVKKNAGSRLWDPAFL
ncbi:MAG: hypothetical protein WD772_07235 [Pseudohongiellaceae bacterium]